MIYGLLLVFFRPHTLQTHYNKAIVKAKLTIKLLLWISALVFFRAKMTLFNGIREKCWTKGVGKVRGRIWIYGKFMFPSDFPLLFTILSGTQIPLQRPKINFFVISYLNLRITITFYGPKIVLTSTSMKIKSTVSSKVWKSRQSVVGTSRIRIKTWPALQNFCWVCLHFSNLVCSRS